MEEKNQIIQEQNENINEIEDQIEDINETDLDMAIYLENGTIQDEQTKTINKLIKILEEYKDQKYQDLNKIKFYNCWLGLCYIWGRKPLNLDKQKGIVILLEQNVKKDPIPLSFTALGECFRWGYGGMEQDHEKSIQYFIEGAERGDRRAQWELGNRYFWGDCIYKDIEQAHELWELSYQQNYIQAIFQYGANQLKGNRGYQQNEELGMRCIQMAIDRKYQKAIEYMKKLQREEEYKKQYTQEELNEQQEKEEKQKLQYEKPYKEDLEDQLI